MGSNYLSITKLQGATLEVWESIINISPHFTGHVITYSYRDLSKTMLVKGVTRSICIITILIMIPRFQLNEYLSQSNENRRIQCIIVDILKIIYFQWSYLCSDVWSKLGVRYHSAYKNCILAAGPVGRTYWVWMYNMDSNVIQTMWIKTLCLYMVAVSVYMNNIGEYL